MWSRLLLEYVPPRASRCNVPGKCAVLCAQHARCLCECYVAYLSVVGYAIHLLARFGFWGGKTTVFLLTGLPLFFLYSVLRSLNPRTAISDLKAFCRRTALRCGIPLSAVTVRVSKGDDVTAHFLTSLLCCALKLRIYAAVRELGDMLATFTGPLSSSASIRRGPPLEEKTRGHVYTFINMCKKICIYVYTRI